MRQGTSIGAEAESERGGSEPLLAWRTVNLEQLTQAPALGQLRALRALRSRGSGQVSLCGDPRATEGPEISGADLSPAAGPSLSRIAEWRVYQQKADAVPRREEDLSHHPRERQSQQLSPPHRRGRVGVWRTLECL